jgi:uncharacterized protein YbbK (DUF523 family)
MDSEYIYLVSACLTGISCRYDGTSRNKKEVAKLVKDKKAFPVCPEVLAKRGIPRKKTEIEKGEGRDVLLGKSKVLEEDGTDVTPQFVKGAKETLKIAKKFKIKKAIMKQKSPSCGCGLIYIKGQLVKGNGVTTALLKNEGIEVIPSE